MQGMGCWLCHSVCHGTGRMVLKQVGCYTFTSVSIAAWNDTATICTGNSLMKACIRYGMG